MVKMWLVALLLISMPQTHAENSALQAALSENGLQKVTDVLTNWLLSKVTSFALPEVRGNVDIGIGSVNYVLHDMYIQGCDLPEPTVAFSEGTGLSLQVSGLSIAVSGHWNTHFGIIDDSGWFDLAVYAISLNSVLQLGDISERLSISAVACSAAVASVKVNFHGGGSFIFQPFVDIFSGRITGMVREKICPAFGQSIADLESHLAVMPVAMQMGSYVYVDVSLMESPLIKSSGLGLKVKGEFYSISSPSEPPFSPNFFELRWREDYMVSMGASEFCVNSASYALHSAGVLQKLITDDMIPKASPIHLNTTQFGALIPQLLKMYPNMPMEVQLYASETPLFSFSETVINVHLLASAKFFAMGSDSAAIPLFRLDMESTVSAKAYTDKQLLKGVVEMKNFTVTLGSTEIGDFPIGPIERMIQLAMRVVALPKVNALLKDGIMVPFVTGFNISNSVMSIENGFLAIAADISAP